MYVFASTVVERYTAMWIQFCGEYKTQAVGNDDNDNEIILLPCNRYIVTSNHTYSIHHYWYHLEYSTLDKHTWQTGLEAMAYVPQYMLNKMNVKWG